MFFERPPRGSKALLILTASSSETAEEIQALESDFTQLVESIEMEVVESVLARLRSFHPDSLLGSGKLDEIVALAEKIEVDVILFSCDLSARQERNLERRFERWVCDRSNLILQIFASRARTHEGKLQVEAAQIEYAMGRLIRGWSHLDRQKGGIGLRGAGETQFELDRRALNERSLRIRKKLEKIRARRSLSLIRRERQGVPTVSLVGYTNAGKTSLFNRLTTSNLLTADKPFVTLDPTLRRLAIPGYGPVMLTDTVGFIRDLPGALIQAFKATLEEVSQADLLLHVVDASLPRWRQRKAAVEAILAEVSADQIPRLLVFNKSDLIREGGIKLPEEAISVSALDGSGMEDLLATIGKELGGAWVDAVVSLPASRGELRTRLHELKAVTSENFTSEGCQLTLRMPSLTWRKLNAELGAKGCTIDHESAV